MTLHSSLFLFQVSRINVSGFTYYMISKRTLSTRMKKIAAELAVLYPSPKCALNFRNPLEILIATILSAQCTDNRVNMVTADLFQKYQTAEDFANAPIEDLEAAIHSTGFYHNKAKNIKNCCAQLIEKYNGEVPPDIEKLAELPGVGRKTANVVLTNGFGIASGIAVDTHVIRLTNRWGLVETEDPLKIENVLTENNPQENWIDLGHQIILHGRAVCSARKPHCDSCTMAAFCPSCGKFS